MGKKVAHPPLTGQRMLELAACLDKNVELALEDADDDGGQVHARAVVLDSGAERVLEDLPQSGRVV